MDLKPGDKLGPYEILSAVGKGGMGEVWKARDTRLDRIVAIKTAHGQFSERFEREARSIAALNHPNICQVYDVGPDYLVMEFVEGAPVSPPDSARKLLDIAVQVGEGLAAAHAAGIVHRDLKPDNILITREGRVRILDFGLAKAAVPEIGSADETRANPIGLTDPGTTVGTISYMSPEQARGQVNLTQQSDQFSLGLVLYELAAGRRAFQRDSAAEIMTAIIREDVEPLPASVPAPFRWIVERLLQKEPGERYDSTRDLYRELRQVRDRLSESNSASISASAIPAVAATSPRTPRPSQKFQASAVAAVIMAAIAGWVLRPAPDAGRYRYTPMEVNAENPSAAAWSPDGKAFVYTAGPGGQRRVFLRYLNSPSPSPLTLPSTISLPVGWSPDGKRVFVLGPNAKGQTPGSALFSVPVVGGEPEFIRPVFAGQSPPAISPDGKTFANLQRADDGAWAVFLASPPEAELKRYAPAPFETQHINNGPFLRFSPDGLSLTLILDSPAGRQGWQLPYPAGRGAPRRFLNGLPAYGATPQLALLSGGRTGVLSLQASEGSEIHLWMAGLRSGVRRQITSGTSNSGENFPAVSPDGKRVLFVQGSAEYSLLSASLSDASVERVTSSALATSMPAWASRQEKFVYTSDRSGSPAIWIRSEGWDRPVVTTAAFPPGSTAWFMTPSLSPGADRVIYHRTDSANVHAIWISSVSGGPPVRLTSVRDPYEISGCWSPDGTRFVYLRSRNGTYSLMAAKTSGEATPLVLREGVGYFLPQCSPDGQWITFFDTPKGAATGAWNLISPDGKTVHSLSAANGGGPDVQSLEFSADSKSLYGIRQQPDRNDLFSIDIATGKEKTIGQIGKDFTPRSPLFPGVRLSLSPDGRSVMFPSVRGTSSLWMLEGFDPPGWAMELREMLP